jgi:hypothetical protein
MNRNVVPELTRASSKEAGILGRRTDIVLNALNEWSVAGVCRLHERVDWIGPHH